jgi:hypothetical protein
VGLPPRHDHTHFDPLVAHRGPHPPARRQGMVTVTRERASASCHRNPPREDTSHEALRIHRYGWGQSPRRGEGVRRTMSVVIGTRLPLLESSPGPRNVTQWCIRCDWDNSLRQRKRMKDRGEDGTGHWAPHPRGRAQPPRVSGAAPVHADPHQPMTQRCVSDAHQGEGRTMALL